MVRKFFVAVLALTFSSLGMAQDLPFYKSFSITAEERSALRLGTGYVRKGDEGITHFVGPEVGVKFDLLPKDDGTFRQYQRVELLGAYQLIRKASDLVWSNKFYAGGSRLPIDGRADRTIGTLGVQTGLGEAINNRYFGLVMGLKVNSVDSNQPTRVGGREIDQLQLYFGCEGIFF